MIAASIHYSLSCDKCGMGYGELGDPENLEAALKGTGWGIVGHKCYCDHCIEAARQEAIDKGIPEAIPEPGQRWGEESLNGWIKTSERIPPAGVEWVIFRTEAGEQGFGKFNYSTDGWEDESGKPLGFIPPYWHFPIQFP